MVVDARVRHLIREATRLRPGRPALRLGLRAAAAVIAPLAIAAQVGTLFATWATLGGFGLVLVDKGGAYRTRAQALAATALGGTVAVLAGTLAARNTAAGIVAVTLGTTACALAAAWGLPAVAIGNTIAVQLVVATTLPADPARPWLPALGFAAGAAWTMFLALVLWPVRVYRPARQAAGACLRSVGAHVLALATPRAADWRASVTARHRGLRETFEAARQVLAETRRGRRGESGRGERLLLIVQLTDQSLGVVIALEELLDALPAADRAALDDTARRVLGACHDRLIELAGRILVEARLPPLPPLAAGLDLDPAAAPPGETRHALAVLARLAEDVDAVAALVDTLADDGELTFVPSADADHRPTLRERLADVARADSPILRHALRVGAVALASMLLTSALDIQRGYWVTLTAVLLLQPYLPATITKGLQRVGGTILGGVIAAILAALIHDRVAIAVIIVALAGVSSALLQLNYGLYALFLTPMFVLLAEAHAPDSHIVGLRIVNTLYGAGLAVLAAGLLWPSRESARVGDRLAEATLAVAAYLAACVEVVAQASPARSPAVVAARRQMGRTFNEAELSLERILAGGPSARQLEAQMTCISVLRRMAGASSAFATARHLAGEIPAAEIRRTGAAIGARLETIAAALRARQAPALAARVLPDAPEIPPVLAARLARLELQLAVLGEAAARAVG